MVCVAGAACRPGPDGAGSTTTGDSSGSAGDSAGVPTGSSGETAGATTGETSGDSTGAPCEPTTEPACSDIPVTPGGERGCGGEELSIAGCDQLAGYERCPNRAVHRHTASVPCDDVGLCDPSFTCHTDDDCGPDEVCFCDLSSGPFQRFTSCVPAQCRTDADCAFGMRCGVDTWCGYVNGLACHTPEDGCEGDADCPERCAYSGAERRWYCVGGVFCE